ncbi:MAG: flagellar hook-associated protein FlgK [Lachnospiraceae bacterium]|nr:flagellar hook-associated protein FlgK [Lachnospiraceae bacterium]
MPSTFWGLNIATSGLNASQIAVNTTTHNIANSQTNGFSRQSTNAAAAEALRTYQSFGMQGSGVTVSDITRTRDSYYDNKYWNNNAEEGHYDVKHYYMDQIELQFNEFGTSTTGFTTMYGNFFNALDELSNYPSEINYRNVVLQYGEALAEYFTNISTNLKTIQNECNNEIKNIAARINTYANGIASLNEQINTLEMNGGSANDLKDKRDVLVDELSKLVSITVIDELSDTGSSSYKVKINGQILVEGHNYNELTTVPRTEVTKRNDEDMQGLYDLQWESGVTFDLYYAGLTGEIKGYVDIRDGNDGQVTLTGEIGVAYKGIPDYLEEINDWVRIFAYELNELHVTGETLEGDKAEPFYILKDMTLEEQQKAADKEGISLNEYIKNNMTADNWRVNPAIATNPYKLATTVDVSQGPDNQDLILKLAGLRDERIYVSGNAEDCFQRIVSAIAINTSAAKNMEDSFTNIGKAIVNQRLSISGVDEDEEAMDLVKYQNAYELAAKALTVMEEILDKLINGTAV